MSEKPKFRDRLSHAWNAFRKREPATVDTTQMRAFSSYYGGYTARPDRKQYTRGVDRSVVASVYTKIAMDVAALEVRHVRVNDESRYVEDISSGLNRCLTTEANIDQTGRALIQDIVESMFDEGEVAVVPVETTLNPETTGSYDITNLRVGQVINWYPQHVRVKLYNEKTGIKEEVVIAKKNVAIIVNPLYAVMNEPNSTVRRLIRKLNLLDAIDEQTGSGKLDIIIQLPYVVKSESRRAAAEQRSKDIEMQLSGSKYGIAYIDGTERITQLNRPAENNLLAQVEYLTRMVYSQLGMTESVFDGTADEPTMLNYYNRSVEPVIDAITDEMTRKFITKTGQTQLQRVKYFRNPFKLVPVEKLAEIADKFTRNEILSSNEIRGIIGYKPSDEPTADELRNKNLNVPKDQQTPEAVPENEEKGDEIKMEGDTK